MSAAIGSFKPVQSVSLTLGLARQLEFFSKLNVEIFTFSKIDGTNG
jgi:hypothetical protein